MVDWKRVHCYALLALAVVIVVAAEGESDIDDLISSDKGDDIELPSSSALTYTNSYDVELIHNEWAEANYEELVSGGHDRSDVDTSQDESDVPDGRNGKSTEFAIADELEKIRQAAGMSGSTSHDSLTESHMDYHDADPVLGDFADVGDIGKHHSRSLLEDDDGFFEFQPTRRSRTLLHAEDEGPTIQQGDEEEEEEVEFGTEPQKKGPLKDSLDPQQPKTCVKLSGTKTFSILYANITQNQLPPAVVHFGEVAAAQMTVSGWLNLHKWPYPNVEWCVISQGSWDNRFKLSIGAFGMPLFTVNLGNRVIYDLKVERSLQPNVWYHLTAVYDGVIGRISVYLNGVLLAQSPREAEKKLQSTLRSTAVPLTVGKCVPEEANKRALYEGFLGGVRMYSRALEVNEIFSSMYWNDANVPRGHQPIDMDPEDDEGLLMLGDKVFDSVEVISKWHGPIGQLTRMPKLTLSQFTLDDMDPISKMEVVVPVERSSWPAAKALLWSILLAQMHEIEARTMVIRLEEMDGDDDEVVNPLRSLSLRHSCYSIVDAHGQFASVSIVRRRSTVSRSWSATLNDVLKEQKDQWFAIVEPHIQVATGWLRAMARHMPEEGGGESDARAIVSRVLYPSGGLRSAGVEFRIAPTVESDEPLPYDRLRGVPLNYRASTETGSLVSFYSYVTLVDTEAAKSIGGWRTNLEPPFAMVDFSLRLGGLDRSTGRHKDRTLMYAPSSIVFYRNPTDLAEDAIKDYMVSDLNQKAFLDGWATTLHKVVQLTYKSTLKTKWIMHCGGSQGFEATMLLRGLEAKAPVRASIRRFKNCEAFDTIGKLPAVYRDTIERTRLKTFGQGVRDDVVVYHRDYREIGLWVEQPSSSYIVGRYMFETDGLHSQWVEQCRSVHEVWVPTDFHVEVFTNSGVPREKIFKVPEALDTDYYDERNIEPLYIPNRKGWVFLSVFKMEERKGWKELIKAFVEEFTGDDDVMLYIHTHLWNAEGNKFEATRIKKFIMDYIEAAGLMHDNLPVIEVTGRYLSSPEILQLFRAADAYVLPTHGEGWGLPYHEAMALGKPTIGTRWGGNTEFMNDDVAYMIDVEKMVPSDSSEVWLQGFKWAQPSVKHLRQIMRTVFSNPEEARKTGRRGRRWVKTYFSVEAVGEEIAKHLQRIEQLVKLPVVHSAKLEMAMASGIRDDVRACMTRPRHQIPPRIAPNPNRVPRIGIISTFPPRLCGIGVFTNSLIKSMRKQWRKSEQLPVEVIAMVLDTHHDVYDPSIVKMQIRRDNLPDYYAAASYINANIDILLIQHEFAIFGGYSGNLLVCMMHYVSVPIVTTIHTIKEDLTDTEHTTLMLTIAMSDHVVVMNDVSEKYLDVFHAIQPKHLSVIHHGVPEVDFVDSNDVKTKFGLDGKLVMVSLGLITPGKGLEYVIDALPAVVKEVANFVFVIAGQPHPTCGKVCHDYYRLLQASVAKYGLQEHVLFIKRSFKDEELVQLVQATDFFITAYPDPSTSSSGTASLAMSAGRVVLSTPYTWALDALRNDRGVYIPFKESAPIAKVLIELAVDPDRRAQIARNAYEGAGHMLWSICAQKYIDTLLQTYKSSFGETRG
mmetsp:Transcript_28331/g.45893  ORF Transcript_28331/g.45893 Transcript_28331/m.45893 type:complete len:1586 (+) Transcript_28331:134-4891(+)